jgi:hypothetical protein
MVCNLCCILFSKTDTRPPFQPVFALVLSRRTAFRVWTLLNSSTTLAASSARTVSVAPLIGRTLCVRYIPLSFPVSFVNVKWCSSPFTFFNFYLAVHPKFVCTLNCPCQF